MSQSSKPNYNTSRSNHPNADPDLIQVLQKFYEAVSQAKAKTLIQLIPYLPTKYQSYRALGKLLGVSHETVRKWLIKYDVNSTTQKGDDQHV